MSQTEQLSTPGKADLADDEVLRVSELKTQFKTEEGTVKAVDDVSFHIGHGETVGVVGESGCGKSVTSLSIMRLVPSPKGKIVSGSILYRTRDNEVVPITDLQAHGEKMRSMRGNEIAMIFQEPMTSLNPVFTVGNQIMEAVRLHQMTDKREARKRAIKMLDTVGIAGPEQRVDEYPHQLSGGMRQRAMIAMALSCNPSLLIADEPTTALDVTIEAQILRLMRDLQRELRMSMLFITHDLGVIGEMASRVIVMYAGKIVEEASTDETFHNPLHPYTRGLLSSIPQIGRKKRLIPIHGSVPSLHDLPPGCPFEPRCPDAMDVCRGSMPREVYVESGHRVRCWLYE